MLKCLALLFILIKPAQAMPWVEKLKLPPQFTVSIFAKVPQARQMALSPKGNLYVGNMEQGKVYLVNQQGKVSELLKDLKYPQGVLWHAGDLYIAEIQRISKIEKVDDQIGSKLTLKTIREFPADVHHGWKTIAIGPDGNLYVPVGAPCNVCNKDLPYQALHRMDLKGKNLTTVASGIRNTVGFTWHPDTKHLYFTEMGRDLMGDDVPPDELNVITTEGQHFGFPYLHGAKIQDPQFAKKIPKNLKVTLPILDIQAHSSPIGITFFPEEKYPKEFHNCFMIAEHGSWNRSKKSGYQVMKGCLKDGKVTSYEPFITGFKEGEVVFARPVHFQFLPDGSFYLSEDEPGTILHFKYRSASGK
jgi:glucose/arabinose dehydrogenase